MIKKYIVANTKCFLKSYFGDVNPGKNSMAHPPIAYEVIPATICLEFSKIYKGLPASPIRKLFFIIQL